jgi:mRNA capping enzyme/mRNA capping enzyme, catalytic domain/mRNA capping enzyme, C-terminal domain
MNEIFYIGKRLNKKWINSFKQLGNNPKPLTKSLFLSDVLPNIDEYYLTDKADGIRCFLLINNKKIKYITSESVKYIDSTPNDFINEYIFDCELIDGIVYIFDVIVYDGKDVYSEPFKSRISYLLDFDKKLKDLPSIDIKVKNFYKLTTENYQKCIMKVNTTKTPYKQDGMIFIESNTDYNDTQNLKWKPPDFLTIDFWAIRYKPGSYILSVGISSKMASEFGIEPSHEFKKLYADIVGINITDNYFPIPFYNSLMPNILYYEPKSSKTGSKVNKASSKISKVDKHNNDVNIGDLHGHIVELSLDYTMKWKFHRIRTDRDMELKSGKYFGNNYKVAETTLSSIMNPLTLADLTSPKGVILSRMYFRKQDNAYLHIKKFNNYVKRILISKYKSDNVIDLASGRGGDLAKYVGANVKHIMMLETDIDAIDEVINRKYNLGHIATRHPFDLHIIRIDLTQNYKKNIKTIDDLQPNTVVNMVIDTISDPKVETTLFCHFAMHYFVETAESAKNIIEFIDHYLQKESLFIMTIFDGQRVFDLLKGGKWNPTPKYMISHVDSKVRSANTFAGFNHRIKVLLPFSDHPYEETLIDLVALDVIFNKHKIRRIEDRNFDDMLDEYNANNQKNRVESQYDRTFISLYKYVIYKKF